MRELAELKHKSEEDKEAFLRGAYTELWLSMGLDS